MDLYKGVYQAKKLDGSAYYRASFTYKNKHISLGSFADAADAADVYKEASRIASDETYRIDNYDSFSLTLSFPKYVSIINYRDNHMYIKNPLYIFPKYFEYYLNSKTALKFDVDDLFYYSNHKIMKRNNHLFVADYGMQVSILSRYGIKNYAVPGKDFLFVNGDITDYRYSNIKIINKYIGVSKSMKKGHEIFTAKIHINGDFIIGRYSKENDAAIAYNKAVDFLKKRGVKKNFSYNYIEEINSIEYASRYNALKISKKLIHYETIPQNIYENAPSNV